MIEVKEVEKSYGSLQVLKKISLTIENNKVVTIVGPSGAGTSTLLHIIGTLDKADRGEVIIDGVNLNQLSDDKLAEFRNRHIGFVYQFHHLLPEFTALENVMMPALIAGKSRKESFNRAQELLDFLKLGDRVGHKPAQLSGGEQQRVSVARALAANADIVIMDEPFKGLDEDTRARAAGVIQEALRGRTLLLVTHDPDEAAMFGGRILDFNAL